MLPGPISRVNTKLAPDVSVTQGVFLEMFFTAYLLFVVLMVAAEKSKDTYIAPVAIGLAAFVALIPGTPGYDGRCTVFLLSSPISVYSFLLCILLC